MTKMTDEDLQAAAKTEDESITNAKDRGGRRRVPDRRQFASSDHFPERRNLRHRRRANDRRSMLNLKRRKKIERRRMFLEKYSD